MSKFWNYYIFCILNLLVVIAQEISQLCCCCLEYLHIRKIYYSEVIRILPVKSRSTCDEDVLIPQKTALKTKPPNLRSPHTSHINTHPKPISQATSAHIRSSSLNPHQHTSEALLSSHISIHPKLITQPSSSHIRSSSLKSHKTVTKTPDINQPVNQANHLFP